MPNETIFDINKKSAKNEKEKVVTKICCNPCKYVSGMLRENNGSHKSTQT
jgi:hypothetical protein